MGEPCFICGIPVESEDGRVYDQSGLGPYCDACWDEIVLSSTQDCESEELDDANLVACIICDNTGAVCSGCGYSSTNCDCQDPHAGVAVECITCQGFGAVLCPDAEECAECAGAGQMCQRCKLSSMYCNCGEDKYFVQCSTCAGYGLVDVAAAPEVDAPMELGEDANDDEDYVSYRPGYPDHESIR